MMTFVSSQNLNRFSKCFFLSMLLLVLFSFIGSPAQSSAQVKVDEHLFKNLTFRNLGAFRAGCWISDIAVPENPGPEDKYTIYVAARNGGVWKTANNGTTFFPIFDNCGTNIIGSVEVAPSDPSIVWVGTGDNSYTRNSTAGNGIWKSTDAGETFTQMGLRDSHHIARVVIHPTDPDIVYAAVMGHLHSPNPERGVFKTTDGGKNWEKILFINDKVGVVDLAMNRANPNILYAAAYDKVRLPWHLEAGGEGSRVYRTNDGGKSWKVLSNGLPGGKLGRIGIDIHRANPDILYAVIENLNLKPGLKERPVKKFNEFIDNIHEGLVGGEVYRTDDGGDSWRKVSPEGMDISGKAAYSFNEITVDPRDPQKVFLTGVEMQYSLDGGKTWPQRRERERFLSNFGDVRTFWIDPQEPEHMMLGSDGGFYISYDGGKTMQFFYQIPLGEVYDVEVDDEDPYNIYVGYQDHESWKGPVNGWSGSVGPEDWVISGMWDGMYTQVNAKNNRWLYFTTQFGKHHRVDQLKGERTEIMPRAPEGKPFYRYTWTTPIYISPHNGDIIYTGGQMLLRSLDRGDYWQEISPDLTTNNPVKIAGEGHIMFCTITTISESPLKAGVIWVGTDDGRVWLTKDHGAKWEEMTDRIAGKGGPKQSWVSRVFASNHKAGTAYVTKTGYAEDVFKPFIFRTEDFGQTWENIAANLPDSPVWVVHEDAVNSSLLFVGTDQGVYITLDGGKQWTSLQNNIPPVRIRDLLVHPRQRDLVVGTFGRGVWITDVGPLQEMTPDVLAKSFHLFEIVPKPTDNKSQRSSWGNYHMTGDNHIRTRNERPGLHLFYYLKDKQAEPLTLVVEDLDGKTLARIKTSTEPGLHRITWNSPEQKPGMYRFILTDGNTKEERRGTLKPRPYWAMGNPDLFRH